MRRSSFHALGLLLAVWAIACSPDRVTTTVPLDPAASLSRIPIWLPHGSGFSQVSASGSATCAVTQWHARCWGQAVEPPLHWASLRQISSSGSGACAILEDGQVVCEGGGLRAPEGLALATVSRASSYACGITLEWFDPTGTASLVCWGRVPVGMPTGAAFIDVSASDQFACAVRDDGSIACWGDDRFGQATPPAPNTGFKQVTTGLFHACGLKTDGTIDCWGEDSFGRARPPYAGNSGFVQISAGANHNCGLKSDSSIQCWGDFSAGQSTPVAPNRGFAQVDAGGLVTCAVRTNSTLDCWGSDVYQSHRPTSTWFAFSGFLSPIVKAPGINWAVAGAPVILRFSLGSDEGMGILASGWPRSRACVSYDPPPPALPTSGQLVYDAATNTYLYLWNTEAAWKGTCHVIGFKFVDGTVASTVKFQFQ